ncbi:trypsin-like peptidase domain-containing protein [Streptomyces typhae]|uniref:VMAP-C domain-containing protein n=1 Tax=Streptomyces typhae TaxID=2681492 RepID=UPI0012F68052
MTRPFQDFAAAQVGRRCAAHAPAAPGRPVASGDDPDSGRTAGWTSLRRPGALRDEEAGEKRGSHELAMSVDAESDLSRLTRAALVELRPEGGDGMWGTGFFVAPGWILTCAHVLAPHLGKDPGTPFLVRGDGLAGGEPRAARLEAWLLDDDPRAPVPPERDLALVRLIDEVSHPSVWLSDRPARLPGQVVVEGHVRSPEGEVRPWREGMTRVGGVGEYGMRVDGFLPFGACGGPAVDPATGEVVALARSRHAATRTSLLVSTTALHHFGALGRRVLAAHDAWHAHRAAHDADTWTALQRKLPGGLVVSGDQWSPGDRGTALALLAALGPPPSPRAVTETLRAVLSEDPRADARTPPRSWRDGHGMLYGQDTTPAVVYLRYLHLVAQYARQTEPEGGAADRLLAWVRERTGEVAHFLRPLVAGASLPDTLRPAGTAGARPFPARGDGRPVVTVELDPVHWARPPRFYWRIGIDHGDGNRVALAEENGGAGVPVADVVRHLAAPLAEAFRRVDLPEQPAPLEVAVPPEHFDMEVHLWRTGDLERPGTQRELGAHRSVVLRALSRRSERTEHLREQRWDALQRADRLTAQRDRPAGTAGGVDRRAATERAEGWEDAGPGVVPVVCRPVGRGEGQRTLREALDAGHAVAVWGTGEHTPPATRAEAANVFARGVAELLGEIRTIRELPDEVRRLRHHGGEGGEAEHWARHTALLWDDPHRPLAPEDTVLEAP